MQVNVVRMPLLLRAFDDLLKKNTTDALPLPILHNSNPKVYVPAVPPKPWFREAITDKVTVHECLQIELLSFSLGLTLGSQPLLFFFEYHGFVDKKIRSITYE